MSSAGVLWSSEKKRLVDSLSVEPFFYRKVKFNVSLPNKTATVSLILDLDTIDDFTEKARPVLFCNHGDSTINNVTIAKCDDILTVGFSENSTPTDEIKILYRTLKDFV
jgi:hypothetical protein